MAKQFIRGNKYVFVAKKCKKDLKNMGMGGNNSTWIKKVNGRGVSIDNPERGTCGVRNQFGVFPQWCKCIGVDAND